VNRPVWNEIEFKYWARGNLTVSINRFGEGPIVMELEATCRDDNSQDEWMTPAAARELAAKLIEAADAADKAGFVAAVGPSGERS
jgi:hypothetical protein